MARKSLSKKLRFDVFKRDVFTCQYCGRTPPVVTLEADHIVSVRDEGPDALHNLITSCFDCNRGKGASSLGSIPLVSKERAEELQERIDQAKAYDKLLRKARATKSREVEKIADIYAYTFEGWSLTDSARNSIKNFLERLPAPQVEEAMENACMKKDRDSAFKYFCGICWNIIKDKGYRK